jgi:redox-sensitive bicupin YhaK (pirin superfamily)
MSDIRKIKQVLPRKPTIEGAGVRLKRAFGFNEVPLLDPFLLLDHFGSANPTDYLAGFPWHPHRGIETVTYMIEGTVDHGDSLGNKGTIGSGDIQWMTAGSGIIHQEMPQRYDGRMMGFQLWVNLPASHKMIAPRYREVMRKQIPSVALGDGADVKIVCGEIAGVHGPVHDIVVSPEYLRVALAPGAEFEHHVKRGHTAFAYVFEGSANFYAEDEWPIGKENTVVFDDGDRVRVTTAEQATQFLLVSGKPINEPVAWRGPIVMNTEEELARAFDEYRTGTFVKQLDANPERRNAAESEGE